jgi:NADH-quinone oxidoreductase subunit E
MSTDQADYGAEFSDEKFVRVDVVPRGDKNAPAFGGSQPWSSCMKSPSAPWSADLDRDFIDGVLVKQAGRPGGLLAILQQVQGNHPRKYLPLETIEYIAAKTKIPLSRVYSVVTFYALFNLQPQGRNTVSVCRGTACHTRGSRDLYEKVMMSLGFQSPGDGEDQLSVTSADGSTTLRVVACFGQCALAPVVEFNHAVFGHMNERTLQLQLDALNKQEPRA